MPTLVWDKVGRRTFESGLDRGVLYLNDGTALVWNGLTSVVEKSTKNKDSVYFDGMKIHDLITVGDFEATMKAVTYPDKLVELEGLAADVKGVYYGQQTPSTFNLSYRTKVGNDLAGEDYGYKIHLLYNVSAVPKDKTYATISDDPSLVEFEWDISAVPEEIEGQRPSAHIIVDSRMIDPLLLQKLEERLYGSRSAWPDFPTLSEMVTLVTTWFRVKIINNGDGTWTAISDLPGFITIHGDGNFIIEDVDAIFLDEYTYQIFTTTHPSDVPLILIEDNEDGSWTASSDHDELISVDEDGIFTIRNATVSFAGPDMYRISDT